MGPQLEVWLGARKTGARKKRTPAVNLQVGPNRSQPEFGSALPNKSCGAQAEPRRGSQILAQGKVGQRPPPWVKTPPHPTGRKKIFFTEVLILRKVAQHCATSLGKAVSESVSQ
jgi:hypothetical protein